MLAGFRSVFISGNYLKGSFISGFFSRSPPCISTYYILGFLKESFPRLFFSDFFLVFSGFPQMFLSVQIFRRVFFLNVVFCLKVLCLFMLELLLYFFLKFLTRYFQNGLHFLCIDLSWVSPGILSGISLGVGTTGNFYQNFTRNVYQFLRDFIIPGITSKVSKVPPEYS